MAAEDGSYDHSHESQLQRSTFIYKAHLDQHWAKTDSDELHARMTLLTACNT